MKDDPYAALSGLDQQLFRDAPADPKKDQRSNKTTGQRNNAGPRTRDNETTGERDNVRTDERASEPTIERGNAEAKVRAELRGGEAMGTRASSPTGQRAQPRLLERHSHDIYIDQVRWLNRRKLEFEEDFGVKVTGNAMVALAIEMLIDDFKRRGAESKLMRRLVIGEGRGA